MSVSRVILKKMPPEGGDLFIGVGVAAWDDADVFGDGLRDGFRDDIDTNA